MIVASETPSYHTLYPPPYLSCHSRHFHISCPPGWEWGWHKKEKEEKKPSHHFPNVRVITNLPFGETFFYYDDIKTLDNLDRAIRKKWPELKNKPKLMIGYFTKAGDVGKYDIEHWEKYGTTHATINVKCIDYHEYKGRTYVYKHPLAKKFRKML